MLELMIVLLLGLAYPKHTTTPDNGSTTVTTYGDEDPDDDTGGDIGNNPPR